jgi:hypothetical protein
MQEEIDRLRERIWITERCHMKAEKRKRFLEYYFHVTLALYALASIAISLFQSGLAGPPYGAMVTFTSICTLSLSLLIFGFKFGESAAQHRSCYLDLQRLRLDGTEIATDLNRKYVDTLSYYPDHSTSDYMSMVMSNILFSAQRIKNPSGQLIRLSAMTRLGYSVYWIGSRLLLVVFFIIPIALTFITIGFGHFYFNLE